MAGVHFAAAAASSINHSNKTGVKNNSGYSYYEEKKETIDEKYLHTMDDDKIVYAKNYIYYKKYGVLYWWKRTSKEFDVIRSIDDVVDRKCDIKVYSLKIPSAIENNFETPDNWVARDSWFSFVYRTKVSLLIDNKYIIEFKSPRFMKNFSDAPNILEVKIYNYDKQTEDYNNTDILMNKDGIFYKYDSCISEYRKIVFIDKLTSCIELLPEYLRSTQHTKYNLPITKLYKCKYKYNDSIYEAYFYSTIYDKKDDFDSIFDAHHLGSNEVWISNLKPNDTKNGHGYIMKDGDLSHIFCLMFFIIILFTILFKLHIFNCI